MPPLDTTRFNGGVAGVVVLGHGSRAPAALELLNWVADRLQARLGTPVLAASLQFNRPTLEDCCRELAAAGCRRIVVAPYFLFLGNHLQKDIPEVIDRLRSQLPETEIILASSLGADDLLVEVLARRTLEKTGALENAAAAPAAMAPETGIVEEAAIAPETAKNDAADVFAGLLDAGCGTCAPLPQHPIEVRSFEIIDSLLEPADAADPEYQVARRIVHTTGDPSMARALLFSPGAVGAGVSAIAAGGDIYCDVNMAAAGIAPTAARLGLKVSCLVAAPAVAALAGREGITRGAAAMRLAARGSLDEAGMAGKTGGLNGAIVAIGNAPTALFELLRLVEEEGAIPALVVGVPVGFVGAAESKEALAASDLPFITLPGNRGGSTVAAAVVNALLRQAAGG